MGEASGCHPNDLIRDHHLAAPGILGAIQRLVGRPQEGSHVGEAGFVPVADDPLRLAGLRLGGPADRLPGLRRPEAEPSAREFHCAVDGPPLQPDPERCPRADRWSSPSPTAWALP